MTGSPAPLRAVTVRGLVRAEQLGFVLPHEHVTADNRVHHLARPGIDPNEEMTAERAADVRVWPHAWRTNLVLDDDHAALADLRRYRADGGASLVELTPQNLGRDPERLRRIAAAADVHVIGATGYYVVRSHPADLAARQDLAAEPRRDRPQHAAGNFRLPATRRWSF